MPLKPPQPPTAGVPSVLDVIDDTTEFVAAPTGDADTDTATLVEALESNVSIRCSPGTYLVYPDELVAGINGHDLIGAGFGANGTVFKAATTGDYVLKLGSSGTGTDGRRGHIAGIRIDGDDKADVGLRIYSGSYSEVERIYATNNLDAGVYFDTEGTGNNNSAILLKVVASFNGGVGIGCAADQVDNNAVEMYGITCTSNGSHGVLWKGRGLNLWGGHLESNTGYGFQAGEAADAQTIAGIELYYPWVENNTAGGVLFKKAQWCTYRRKNIDVTLQEMDFTNSQAENRQIDATATGVATERIKSGTDGRYVEIGYDRIMSQGGTDTDRDLYLTLKGKGGVKIGTSVSSNNPGFHSGSGSPDGSVAAPKGSIYLQTDGGVVTCLWKKAIGATNLGWVPAAVGERTQTIATDANFTLNPYSSPEHTLHTGTLTAGRTVTLTNNANAFAGMHFKITRTGGGAFNLDVGGLKNLATNQWCEVIYDGTNWKLAAFGAL